MTLLDSFRRFWPFTLAVVLIAVGGVYLFERATPTVYTASGTVMIAVPEVDPAQAAARAIDLPAAIAEASSSEARAAFAAAEGSDDFRILQVSDSRLQVLANGDDAALGVRAVLRALADAVAAQQLQAGVEVDERIRPRLFVQVPEGELESLATVEGQVTGEIPDAIGTFVLEDPLLGARNALGSVSLATRLVLLSVTSDAGSQALSEELPDGVDFAVNSYDRRARELITVTTTGPEPTDVLTGFDTVSAALGAELQRRQEQAEAPLDDRLLVDVIAAPLEAQEVDPGLSMWSLVLLVLGIGVAVALPGILREAIGARPPAAGTGTDTSDELEPDLRDRPAGDDISRAAPTR